MNLDARQRAMLDEMGVKVWWPAAATATATAETTAKTTAAAVAAVASPPLAAAAAVATAAEPAQVPAIASRAITISNGAATVLIDSPRRLYADGEASARLGGWLIVADMPPDTDGRHGEPFSGDAGKLLDNMLRALQLHVGALPVHLMRTHRGIASGRDGSPHPFADGFLAQAEALAPRVIMAMGPLAAQSLLRSTEPLGRLRGRAAPMAALNGVPVVATYHPAYLLRNMADKARAWADLCLAADQVAP
ncbi:uracil-DNA glycosylase [Variovorax sp. RHLX14]|uniref:uracil-DNA glycosylase n=1 Tax=Variovorax sp. RHLX14 TaxID=1259731 RepID=UPI003F45842E